MINFLLYGLSFASSLLIIANVPEHLTQSFLSTFSASNLVFSICVVLAFSSEKVLTRVKIWTVVSLTALVIQSAFLGDKGIWILYVGVLLIADYLTSQSDLKKLLLLYRLALVLTAIPFIFLPQFKELIMLRLFLGIVVIVLIILRFNKIETLKIKNVYSVVAISNLAYFGSLFLLTQLLPKEMLRFWYIGMQISLGIILKLYDFSVRRDTYLNRYLVIIAYIFIGMILIFLESYYFSILALGLYLFSLFILSKLSYLSKLMSEVKLKFY